MKTPTALLRFLGLTGLAILPAATSRGQLNYITPYTFTTFAGDANRYGSADGAGSAARFNTPPGVAIDSLGNVYVADSGNHTIRKITSGGVVTTLAGVAGSSGSVDGTSSATRFKSPRGIAVDEVGNIFVTDTGNSTIRKITAGGVVTTFAGSAGNPGSADGTGTASQFNFPQRLAVDGSGNLYVADTINSTIRKITSGGVVTTLAGSALNTGSTDGTGSAALFNLPSDVAVDSIGNVFVADRENQTIRKITSGGVVTTLAGTVGVTGSTNGTGGNAKFQSPTGLTVDSGDNVYVGDSYNNAIRKITSGGLVTTLAGSPQSQGSDDGSGSAARFFWPSGVAADGAGNVFVADEYNGTIRKVTSGGMVTTLAGSANRGAIDGVSSAARFNQPTGIAVDMGGNAYVADQQNHTIRKITGSGAVTTLAGSPGNPGSTDGTGGAAQFYNPRSVAIDSAGNIYVADDTNHTIRKITSAGVVTTLAGAAGSGGSTDGVGSDARFLFPSGVAVDASGNVFVADSENHTIRKITRSGVVMTLAGLAGSPGSTDGTGSAARFNHPFGVAVDSAGTVYVADSGNHAIRKIASDGTVTTLAGSASSSGSADGTGSGAQFSAPCSVAVDNAGNVYVADQSVSRIRRVTSAGVVSTLGGALSAPGSADGTGSAALFYFPQGVATDGVGNVYIADTGNSTIRKGMAAIVANDFNRDSNTDIVWQNIASGDRGFWLMHGPFFTGWVDLGVVATDWRIAGTADFDGDGKTDILWENTTTGDRGFWLMNGTTFTSWVDLGVVSTNWRIAAAADFNGDGKPDILWENTVTGDRGFWLMNGTVFSSWVALGVVSTDWRVAVTADFNGDGKTDLLWENTVTGDRYFWFMNGSVLVSAVFLGNVAVEWHAAAAGDFTADGMPDLVWENTVTGDRYFWIMNGSAVTSSFFLGNVATDWRIAN